MAQIAIPVLLVGVAYLMSNEKEDTKKDKEGFSFLNESDNEENLFVSNEVQPSLSKTENNTNNEQTLSQYQDKYYTKDIREKTGQSFQTLAGNKMNVDDLNHNNMNLFYSNKSGGYTDLKETSILDGYTGQGTYDIKKDETAVFFKPESNMQNVYGNQNQNDFLQSRVNSSQRHANTKPWEEIRDTPGIGMAYDELSNKGLNNYNDNREMYTPKTVDELRVKNNPKLEYCLGDHMGPALKPLQRGVQGKVVKQLPDLTFSNDNHLGMMAQANGTPHPMQKPQQMMTNENRPETSVEYYGARGGLDQPTYVSGKYMESHKQQLGALAPGNMNMQGENPTNELNYGKHSFQSLQNNRSTTSDSHFGNIGGLISNVVEPLVKGLRHSKKTNVVTNSNPSGNLNGGYKQPTVFNPNEKVSTTNREMYEGKLSMKHLNVEKQDGTAYMNTRPLLTSTTRSTMNQSQSGPAESSVHALKNYDAEYNQKNITKLSACNVRGNGNMSLFNNKVKMYETNKELCNDRQTPYYAPRVHENPVDMLGSFTNMPQEYVNKNPETIDSSILKAFKSNPYTHSLQSAV